MKKFVLLSILTMLFSSCASLSTMNPEYREKYTKKTYNSNYDNTFNKTLDAIKRIGYPITFVDKENGIINTDPKTINVFLFQQKVNISIVKLNDTQTSVQLFLSIDGKENQNFSDYKEIFDNIVL